MAGSDPEWTQGALEPPVVTEVTIRLGLIPSENHGQWQYEVRSATDDELIEMGSKHHFHLGDGLDELVDLAALLRRLLDSYAGPFDSL